MWVILLAMGVFSSFISSITSTVSSLRTYRQEQSKKQTQLLRFFNERNLSTDLYSRVQEVVQKQGLHQVRLSEQEVMLFQGVPQRLLILMHEEMYMVSVNALDIWPMWAHFEAMLRCKTGFMAAGPAFLPGAVQQRHARACGHARTGRVYAGHGLQQGVRHRVGLYAIHCQAEDLFALLRDCRTDFKRRYLLREPRSASGFQNKRCCACHAFGLIGTTAVD